jgi:hypothetical protein
MSRPSKTREERIEEYWLWFGLVLFLLLVGDLLTTVGAAAKYGVGPEANPLMAWLLTRGPTATLVVSLFVMGVSLAAFAGVVRAVRNATPPYDRYLEVVVATWLGTLVLVGLVVLANNLAVIVLGRSLL